MAADSAEAIDAGRRKSGRAASAMEARAIPAGLDAAQVLVGARLAIEERVGPAQLVRDLLPVLQSRLAADAARGMIEMTVARLTAGGLVASTREGLSLTPAGQRALAARIGAAPLPRTWGQMRDIRLVAVALGREADPARRLSALGRPDGLRSAVVVAAFQLKIKTAASPARVRSALAGVALERAFGDGLTSTLGTGSGLSAKAARLLAGQLLKRPRDPGTDGRLIAQLAAEHLGTAKSDPATLRSALLARTFAGAGADTADAAPAARKAPEPRRPAITVSPKPAPEKPAAASRPDLAGFAKAVQAAARTCAEGWPGNRKAYLAPVYDALVQRHPGWGLTQLEFKAMVAEAHRTGHLALTNVDLKDRTRLKELELSAVTFKNSVLHLVRVDE